MKKLLAILFAVMLLGAACSDDSSDTGADDSDEGTTSSSSTTEDDAEAAQAPAEPITVMVTNDDGVDAEGMDALVEALSARDDVEVIVVAPDVNKSGSGGKTTGGVLEATEATTASGFEATAVNGFPADSVIYALDQEGLDVDLVISGINDGQNIAQVVDISGTVGAARQAAQLGVPALATSQGFGDPPDFPSAVGLVMEWLDDNIDAVRSGELGTDTVASLNVPTCVDGSIQGLVEVPVSGTDGDISAVDCSGSAAPTDDLVAFTNGWATLSALAPTGSRTTD
ncbi:MAG: 5'/3'-nucleotidase SurE [Microthrixaceae bacterium]